MAQFHEVSELKYCSDVTGLLLQGEKMEINLR